MRENVQLIETNSMCDLNKRVSEVISNTFLINKRCFIIAGGPSLKDKFDFSKISNEVTIGMNMSFERYPTTLWHGRDDDLYQNIISGYLDKTHNSPIRSQFESFKGIKVFLAQPARVIYSYNVYVVNRLYKERISYDVKDGIYAGSNSCFSAIMLAISLGCRDIYLLGADMKVTTQTHWHQRYDHTVNEFARRCLIFKQEMEEWSSRFKIGHINITPLYMDSPDETSLNCFPKKKFKDFLT